MNFDVNYEKIKAVYLDFGWEFSEKHYEALSGTKLDKYNYAFAKKYGSAEHSFIKSYDFHDVAFTDDIFSLGDNLNSEYTLSPIWLRGIELSPMKSGKLSKKITYGTVESLNSWMLVEVGEGISAEINKIYPSKLVFNYGASLFVQNSNDTELFEFNSSAYDNRFGTDKERINHYKLIDLYKQQEKEIAIEIKKLTSKYSGMLFCFSDEARTSKFSESKTYIVGGSVAAKSIIFGSFFKDASSIEQPEQILFNERDKLVRKIWRRIFFKHKLNNFFNFWKIN